MTDREWKPWRLWPKKSELLKDEALDRALHRLYNRQYAAPRRQKSTPEWAVIRARIFARDNYTCVYCAKGGRLECDHVMPVSRGGSNEDDNLATACFKCNRSKGNKTLEEWRRVAA